MALVRKTVARLVGTALILGSVGCNLSSEPPDLGPEDRGTLILDHLDTGFGPDYRLWTKDGSELVFIAQGLKVVNLSSHLVRVLDPGSVANLARGVNGEWVYYTASVANPAPGAPSARLSRVHPATGVVQTVATLMTLNSSTIAVSADERWVAVGGLLIDTQGGTSRALPNGNALAFSPDGSRLLHEGFSPNSRSLISTADLSSQPVVSPDGFFSTARWVGNSPQFLTFRTNPPVSGALPLTDAIEIDGLSGTERKLAQFDAPPSPSISAWSDDGSVLGVWINTHFGPQRNELALIRPGTGTTMVLSVGAFVGRPNFSPSGNAVVYPVYTATGDFSGYTTFYLKSGI